MQGLKPFFCYFGGKWRVATKYPYPKYNTVIEPFAGAAGYSLRHYASDIVLYDIDPVIYGIWDYLIKAKKEEILKLPIKFSSVNDLSISQEARHLIGFWLNKGSTSPSLTPSAWMRSKIRPNSYWGETIKNRIANQVDKIKHWKIFNKSYEEIESKEATWFIDPPYQGKSGTYYRYKNIDHNKLGEWCTKLSGQAIVCEKEGATWLPFKEFRIIKSTPGIRGKSYSKEVLWTN